MNTVTRRDVPTDVNNFELPEIPNRGEKRTLYQEPKFGLISFCEQINNNKRTILV